MNGSLMGMGNMSNQHTLQTLQQQMQQWNLGSAGMPMGNMSNMSTLPNGMGAVNAVSAMPALGNSTASPLNMTQFAFPNNLALNGMSNMNSMSNMGGMNGMLNSAPNLFGQVQAQAQQTSSQPLTLNASNAHSNPVALKHKEVGSENESPRRPPRTRTRTRTSPMGMSLLKDNSRTWSKKQQELGDKLYQKVFARTGGNLAPKITGMLIKMGDKKAQKCIDDEPYLLDQIHVAKKLLLSQVSRTPSLLPPPPSLPPLPLLMLAHSVPMPMPMPMPMPPPPEPERFHI